LLLRRAVQGRPAGGALGPQQGNCLPELRSALEAREGKFVLKYFRVKRPEEELRSR
jgi:hypothetical protein